jgi:hypothetical protein
MNKKCTKCKIVKSYNDFHIRRKSSDGVQSMCKECTKKSNFNRREKIKEWHDKNPDKILLNRRKYENNNRDKLNLKVKARYHNNEDYRNRENERGREWRRNNSDRYRELMRSCTQARRARKRKAFYEHIDFDIVYERDKGICGICKKPVDVKSGRPYRREIEFCLDIERNRLRLRRDKLVKIMTRIVRSLVGVEVELLDLMMGMMRQYLL